LCDLSTGGGFLDISIQDIDSVLNAYPSDRRYALAILQDMQREFHYIPRSGLSRAADYLNCRLSELYSMATFYKALSLTPKGRHIIKVCDGTACHIRGSVTLLDALTRKLGVGPGETTADGLFSLETVNCLGACAIAPVMLVGEEYHGSLTSEKLDAALQSYIESEAGQ
jgi:NADH-quinone oxidoreductase subunit E